MKKYEDKTKDQLINELIELSQRINELEKSENQLKQAEEALRKIEKRFRELTELLPEIVFEMDIEGNFTFINQIGFDTFGYTQGDLDKGLNAFQLIVPEDRNKAKENLRKRQRGEDLGIVEYTMQRKDGSRFPILIHASIVIDEEGKHVGLRGVAVNITERRRMEEVLRESEKRFRELVDLLPQTVFETDEKGNLTFTNAYGLKSSGYTQEDLDKGLNALQLFIPEDRDRVKENMRRILRGEKLGSKEYTALKKNGSTFPVIIYSSPIIYENRPVGLRGIVIDITERKRAEEALKQRAEELERSKAELEQSLQELLERVEHEHKVLVTLPVPVIDIEEKGATFLYPLDKEKEVYALFLSRKDANRPALAITRTFPPRFHKKLGREVETVWLTSNRVPSMVCVDPSDTMNLLLVLTEFFKRAPEGVVLFEGVEYVISIAGFERFLHIVQLLNDKIAMTEGAIYMILDLAVLEKKERRYILRECLSPLNGFGNGEGAKGSKNKA